MPGKLSTLSKASPQHSAPSARHHRNTQNPKQGITTTLSALSKASPHPRRFALELDTFDAAALEEHRAAAHKHCRFCDSWHYAVDELWAHMTAAHCLCAICNAAGTPHLYLRCAVLFIGGV
jgi:hypothetical protein